MEKTLHVGFLGVFENCGSRCSILFPRTSLHQEGRVAFASLALRPFLPHATAAVCIPVSSPLSPTPLRCGVPHFPRLPHRVGTLLSPQKARIHRRDKGWLPLPLLSSPDGDAGPPCGSPRRLGGQDAANHLNFSKRNESADNAPDACVCRYAIAVVAMLAMAACESLLVA